jgi:phage shock protein C
MTAESTAPTGRAASPGTEPRSAVRRLHRSRTNRVLAGVCGGIAEHFGSDPTAVRLATVVLGLFTGIVPMVIAYIIAAIVIPESEGAEAGIRADVTPGQWGIVFGALLILLGIAGFANVWLHVEWDQVWPLALIGLGLVIVAATVRPRR